MALPTFVAAGAAAEGTTGDISPAFPTHQADDIALLICESNGNNNDYPAPSVDWAHVADSPQLSGGAATDTRLTIFWIRCTSGGMTAPVLTTGPGNHKFAQILVFRGCIATGNPWDVTAGDSAASSTAVSIPGDTTTVADCLIVAVASRANDLAGPDFGSWANADLANVAEVTDVGTALGSGGGFGVATGEKATAGAYSATTATLGNAALQARISIALKPPVAAGVTVEPGLGELAATGLAPVVQTPRTVTTGLGEVAATGFAPTVLLPVTVSTGLGELVVTGFAPTVLTPLTLLLDVGTATLAGFAPTIQTPVTVTPGTGLLTVTGFAPTLGDEVTVEPGLGELVATGFAPTVQAPRTVTLGFGEVTVSGFAPVVLSPVTVLPGFGELVFAGFAPTIGAEPIADIVIDPYVQNLSPTMTVRNLSPTSTVRNVSPTVVARRR